MILKRCAHCQEDKELSSFFKQGNGYQAYCKACKYIKQKAWRNSEAGQLAKARRSQTKKHIDEHYKTHYGISLEEYSMLVALAEGKCAICKTVPDGKLFVDHCHTSNKIRGLLCRPCNLLLGFAKDDTFVLEEAVKYLVSSSNLQ